MIDWSKKLPSLLAGDKLKSALLDLPEYDEGVQKEDAATRLIKLTDIFKVYYPCAMSTEIYSKLYLAMLMSLNKKGTKLAMEQQKYNFRAVQKKEFRGIIGGGDSFTIIGKSGIGKTSAIERAITLITNDEVIEFESPHIKIIPIMQVQCPFDCSPKSLLIEILRVVDEHIGSSYYRSGTRAGVTTDTLVGLVSQVCLNHLGLMIIDEIQNVVKNKKGSSLVGVLMQLINSSGISVCMVGVPESVQFFESEAQLARRSLGLKYGELPYDKEFFELCNVLFSYQYTRQRTKITNAIVAWLYDHTGGITSLVVTLLHDAQELAILNGSEKLDINALITAYESRMEILHSRIDLQIRKQPQTSKRKKIESPKVEMDVKEVQMIAEKYESLVDMVNYIRENHLDALEVLRQIVTVEVIKI